MKPDTSVVVLTKVPIAGTVKTRLIPELGAERAALLHQAMAETTIDIALASGLRVEAAVAGPMDHPFVDELRKRLGADAVEAQVEGDLGARLRHALRGPGKRIGIGTDSPTMKARWIHQASIEAAQVTIGPADDGGYWLVAVNGPLHTVFHDIPWSTDRVLETTMARIAIHQLSVALLPQCYDIDDREDLSRLVHDSDCPVSLRARVLELKATTTSG